MSERTCKKCGSIDYDIWGIVGLFGYSLIIGVMGYFFVYALVLYGLDPYRIMLLGIIFGIIFMLPMWMISYHVKTEQKRHDQEQI